MRKSDEVNGILDILAKFQRIFPSLISSVVDVHEEYGFSHSFGRDLPLKL